MAERKARLMHRLRMRTTLLIPLLLLCFGAPGKPVDTHTIVRQQVELVSPRTCNTPSRLTRIWPDKSVSCW